ncbi:uncharacterized protein SPSK_06041 [Sporothrix schenckii 1099-18]|uniref:Uncharacterized protein n=2 Tax=Sporothrix schenckii TaxID=29908 RepID=U7PRM8_SPOS1|nr:uncharacterized protein SPSK_06041 [Sporothrix schenckii 1099-18]ERS98252.1 hypothetical protein HMPREF1624_05035 [Sporothrix schenckii ATCC 58251]KJR89640.1 hypothetical protein SPSK_06041 [Sporothrix schenckii 1099-18]
MLAPPRPGISSEAFTAKPILSCSPPSTSATSPSPVSAKGLPTPALDKQHRPPTPRPSTSPTPLPPPVDHWAQPMSTGSVCHEWVLESEIFGVSRDQGRMGDTKGKGDGQDENDAAKVDQGADTVDSRPYKRQRAGQSSRIETMTYVLYCPNGRKVLLPTVGIVGVAQLCLWAEDSETSSSSNSNSSNSSSNSNSSNSSSKTANRDEPPTTRPIPLVPSGPPQPIRLSPHQRMTVRELVRISPRFHFVMTPHTTSLALTKAIGLVCPAAAAAMLASLNTTSTTAPATETGHLVTHVSRLVGGRWYCRRAPLASVPLLWPANTTLALPITQPLPLLALPRKMTVHVGPETGPGAPWPPVVHEEVLGEGLTCLRYDTANSLAVVLNPLKGQVFTMQGAAKGETKRKERSGPARGAKRRRKRSSSASALTATSKSPVSKSNSTSRSTQSLASAPTQPSPMGTRTLNPAAQSPPPEKKRGTTSRIKAEPAAGHEPLRIQDRFYEYVPPRGRDLVLDVRNDKPVPLPLHPKAAFGPRNPLTDQSQSQSQSQPQHQAADRRQRGPDLQPLLADAPRPHMPQRLPPLRGLMQEVEAQCRAQGPAAARPPSQPPTPTASPALPSGPAVASHLPQHLHQFLRQAPVGARTVQGRQRLPAGKGGPQGISITMQQHVRSSAQSRWLWNGLVDDDSDVPTSVPRRAFGVPR